MVTGQRYFNSEPGLARLFFFFSSLIALGTSVWLWHFMADFSDPPGANGYFYLKQTESLANGVGFYFKDRSLAFALLVLLYKITGQSLESVRIAICIVWFFAVVAFTAVLDALFVKVEERGVLFLLVGLLSVAALVSTTQFYEFNLTYFKNATALMFFLWGMAFALRAHPWHHAGAALFFIFALLTHKSMFLIVGLFALSWLSRSFNLKRFIIFTFAVTLFSIAFLFYFENSAAHLKALTIYLSNSEAWQMWIKSIARANYEMLASMIALLGALVLYPWVRKEIEPKQRFFYDGSVLLLLVTLQPFQMPGPNGPFYRFLLFAPVFGLILLAAEILKLRKGGIFVAMVLLLYLVQPLLSTRYLDDVFTPWNVMRGDVLQIKKFVQPEDHLTSHHGLEFFIDYTTGIRSRSFLSDHPEQKNFRVAYIARSFLPKPEVQDSIRAKALLEIGSDYVLLPEARWQEFMREFNIPIDWRNPYSHRPDFIYE